MTAAAAPADVRALLGAVASLMGQVSAVLSAFELPGIDAGAPLWPGGKPPFGYTAVTGCIAVEPAAADVVRLVLAADAAEDLGPRLRRLPGVAGWSSANLRKLAYRIRRRAGAYRAGEISCGGRTVRHPSLVIAP